MTDFATDMIVPNSPMLLYTIGYAVCACYVWPVAIYMPVGRCGRCGERPNRYQSLDALEALQWFKDYVGRDELPVPMGEKGWWEK